MTFTIASIKKMLSEITQGKWIENRNWHITTPSMKWNIGYPDEDNMICHVMGPSEKGPSNMRFIAASPEIVKFLLERVEEKTFREANEFQVVITKATFDRIGEMEKKLATARKALVKSKAKFEQFREDGSRHCDQILMVIEEALRELGE